MKSIIPFIGERPDPKCAICMGEFELGQEKWTHEGANHDPFHKKCLSDWVKINPTCPIDRTSINPNSLISRVDRMKRVFVNAAYAAAIQATVIAGTAVAVAAEVKKLGGGGAIAEAIMSVGSLTGAVVGAVAGIGALLGAVTAVNAVGTVVAAAAVAAEAGIMELVAIATAVVGNATVPLAEIAAVEMLSQNKNDQINITAGLCVGWLASAINLGGLAPFSLIIPPLAAGVFSGFLTLLH